MGFSSFDFFFLAFILFYFCLVRGEKVASAQDFGWQSKGEDHFRSWFPFFSCLLGDNYVLFRYCLVDRLFCIFLLFSSPKCEHAFVKRQNFQLIRATYAFWMKNNVSIGEGEYADEIFS